MTIGLRFAAACLLATGSLGCTIEFAGMGGPQVTKTIRQDLKVEEGAEVAVEIKSGSITLVPGEAGKVVIDAEAKAESDDAIEKIEITSVQDGKNLKIGWSTSDKKYNRRQVSLKIQAPKDTPLRLKTGAGSIDVEKFTKGLVADTSAGSIDVRDVLGDLTLDSGAGSIDVRGASGRLKADTSAGSVDVRGAFSGDCLAKSGAGEVTVALSPANAMQVEASTGAGSLENAFGWKPKGTVSRQVAGAVGDGSGGHFKIHTSAGSVNIKKAE